MLRGLFRLRETGVCRRTLGLGRNGFEDLGLSGDDLARVELVIRHGEHLAGADPGVVNDRLVLELFLVQLIENLELGESRPLDFLGCARFEELAGLVGCHSDEVVDDQKSDEAGQAALGHGEERSGNVCLSCEELTVLGEALLLRFFTPVERFLATSLAFVDFVLAEAIEEAGLVEVDDAFTVLVTPATVGLRACLGQVIVRAEGGGLLVLGVRHGNTPQL